MTSESTQYPPSWEVVPLGRFVNYNKGKRPSVLSKSQTPECSVPYVDIKAFEEGIVEQWTDGADCQMCEESDFLMVWDGSRSGLVGRFGKGALGSTLMRLNFGKINNQYAFYFLQSKFLEINSRAKGTGTPHVDPDLLWNYEFPIPPLKEQSRIVGKIQELFSELDKSVEILRTAQEQLKVYRQALLKSAFEGALTAEWRRGNASRLRSSKDIFKLIRDVRSANKDRIKSAQAKKFNESAFNESDVSIPLSELPNGWAWVQIGHISTGPSYGTSIKSQPQGDCPVLRMGNIQSCEFDFGDLVFTSDKEEIQKYLLAKGDVLFNRTNSPELVGKTAIFELNTPCIFAGYLVRVNHLPQLVDPHYLNFYLNSPVAKFQGNKVKTDGVNQSNINAEKLSKYPFPYCSIEEQREIVERLKSEMSGIKHLDETLTLEIRRAESLRQTILKRAFQGDLVPQNPEDYSCGILFDPAVAQEAPPNQQAPRRVSAKNRTSKPRKKNEHIDHRL